MDYLLIGIVLLVMFFSLRSNYKLSNVEEKLKKMHQQNKLDEKNNITKIMTKIDSLEKRTVVLQKAVDDFKQNNEMLSSKNMTLFKKQLSAVKNDTDLIKTIYLKTNDKEEEKKETQSKDQTVIEKASETALTDFKPVSSETDFQEDFNVKVKEKLGNMTGDEIWILRQLLSQDPLTWQNVADLQDDISMPQFQIPKLSRKFIIDGLPVLMIKNASDKMLVKWGEGLTEDKIETIQKEIRGDW